MIETAHSFQNLKDATEAEIQLMGGKAGTLARLLQKNFPVPQGAVLFREPTSADSYKPLLNWWQQEGSFPLAVRSSASGEDSGDFSYAGQFVTLLNISNQEALVAAIKTCFQAVHRKSSKAYASHFDQPDIPMHVLAQRMITPHFSGVFFSVDPRKENSSWMVEVVEGLGEQLVSGQVTPYRFTSSTRPQLPSSWKNEYLETVVHWGQEVEKTFGYKVDMEWAIDQEGKFWILQSRPITAQAAPSVKRRVLDEEWQRLLKTFAPDSTWDGHTFAEWTGVPTELTFDIWQKAFRKGRAFDLALRSIGYQGIDQTDEAQSLLDRIYGRAYLNLKSMEPIYFGRSPYKIKPFPRPHLEFDWRKLTPTLLLRAPLGIAKMAQVAWSIQTGRHELAKKALNYVTKLSSANKDPYSLLAECQQLNFSQQQAKLKDLTDAFTTEALRGTFLITLLIESTTQGLLALLEKDLGKEKSADAVHLLTGEGLRTIASQMNEELTGIEGSSEKWQSFLNNYGHRGMGELELSHPRWIETQMPQTKSRPTQKNRSQNSGEKILQELLNSLSSIRRPVFKQEWQELQKLLQVREEIKMSLMKPYAQIRWLALALGEKAQLGSDIFWLQIDEILSLPADTQSQNKFLPVIQERKQRALHLKAVDLPMLFTLEELKNVLTDNSPKDGGLTTTGVSLSPGIASGIVHIVTDPENEDLDSWPDNYILVTEATDPGWTPLFQRAKAVVVSRGGVLSHCAIVAREMGLPAVGEIRGASHLFKEGERVWVDGNHGTIRRSH